MRLAEKRFLMCEEKDLRRQLKSNLRAKNLYLIKDLEHIRENISEVKH